MYHENKPSRFTEQKSMEILHRNVFGNRPICFDVISDPEVNFGSRTGRKEVNFKDENMNIGLPIFRYAIPFRNCFLFMLINYFLQYSR